MLGHGIREVTIDANPGPADVLGAARILAGEVVEGDGGAGALAKLAALDARTIRMVASGRVTPSLGVMTNAVESSRPASQPEAAQPSVAEMSLAEPATIPAPDAAAGLTVPAPTAAAPAVPNESAGAPPIAQERPSSVTPSSGIVTDESMWNMFSSAQLPKGSPEELLQRLDSTRDVTATTSTLDDLVLSAENASREGKPLVVADIFHGVVAREANLDDGELKRAYVMAIRRLSRPPLLRAVAMLLPRKRERAADYEMVLVRAGEDGADALIEQLTQATTGDERRIFFDVLVTLKSGIPALIHMLGDARWFVVRNAVDLLGELKAAEAEGAVVELLRHRDDRVRRAATNALMNIGTPGALKAVHDAIRDDSPQVRKQAAAALAGRKDGKSAGTLTKALDDETDADVQLAILTALGKVATPDAVQKLIAAAEPEGRFFKKKSVPFRVAAVQALGEAHTPQAMTALKSLSDDREREVKEAAQRAMAKTR
jgi:HEAT repeat protein